MHAIAPRLPHLVPATRPARPAAPAVAPAAPEKPKPKADVAAAVGAGAGASYMLYIVSQLGFRGEPIGLVIGAAAGLVGALGGGKLVHVARDAVKGAVRPPSAGALMGAALVGLPFAGFAAAGLSLGFIPGLMIATGVLGVLGGAALGEHVEAKLRG